MAGRRRQIRQPVARIESEKNLYEPLETALFDGAGSYDPDSRSPRAIRVYRWVMSARPPGSSSTLNSDGSQAQFFIDAVGSYIVELVVVDRSGLQSEPAHFSFDAASRAAAIHVELVWDLEGSDVDLHLVHASAGGTLFDEHLDCSSRNPAPDWGPSGPDGNPQLDVDDTDGFGPENINLTVPESGASYKVAVHYFKGPGPTNTRVRLFISGDKRFEQTQFIDQPGTVWEVATIHWPSGDITPLGGISRIE